MTDKENFEISSWTKVVTHLLIKKRGIISGQVLNLNQVGKQG